MLWDDLRLALAVSETGSAARAGRRLGVAHTTVSRRLAALEKDAGALLFQRVGAKMVPTDAGRAVLEAAADFARRIELVDRSIRDEATHVSGLVTITAAELLGTVIASILPRLRERHPDLQVRLRVTPATLDLANREADVAVRVNPAPSANLVGKRVAWAELAIYGTAEIVAQEDAPWVCFDDEAAAGPQGAWEAANVPDERIALRTNSRASFIEAVRAGVGMGLLPRVYGDAEPNLVRRGEPLDALKAGVWVLTHSSAAKVPRVQAVTNFLASTLRQNADVGR